ncbi:MAG: putative transposase [Candidatus Azotimanducaceae bacterium]|jgi:putative transposase
MWQGYRVYFLGESLAGLCDALLMAVWQRQPKSEVLVHSDQGSQYASSDYLAFMMAHKLLPSMSRRENCHGNAVAESFFATFKKRVIKQKIYSTRAAAKGEIFNFIEMFYNPIKRHSQKGGVSPATSIRLRKGCGYKIPSQDDRS